MKKYSYHCNRCGHTVLSDNKDEVKVARETHRPKTITRTDGIRMTIPKCLLMDTGRGTVARPSLAEKIKEANNE